MEALIRKLADGVESPVERARTAVQEQIESLTDDITRAEERLTQLQERLRAQFSQMESILGRLQGQGVQLSQQIAALTNGVSISGKK